MPELNKFLDLEGLKVFWDQINEKKQNRTIWYNGKQILIEDCLNEIKKEIENIYNEIGNIENLESINQHIEEIKSTLQEIDNEINNLNENYVPENRTIAGINLENDIEAGSLGAKLVTYSTYHYEDEGDGQDYRGRISVTNTGNPNWQFDKAYILGAFQSGTTNWYKLLTEKDINVKSGENRRAAKLVSQNLLDEELADIRSQQLSEEDILNLVPTYPILTGTNNPIDTGTIVGRIGQLYINENTGLFYICYDISDPATSPYYHWRQIRINTDHIVSSVSSSSTNSQAPSAKLFYNTTQNLQSQFDNLEDTLGHEVGIFGYNDTVLYTENTTDPLKYRPYSILDGTYEKLFSYCTISAQVEKVENWIDLYISLPVVPIEHVSTTVYDFSGIQYTVQTKIRDNLAVAHIRRTDGQAMTRNTPDTDPNSYIYFTLRYKYK